MGKKLPTLKWSIFWLCIHAFSVWIVTTILIGIQNEIIFILIAGLGITIIAKFVRSLTMHETIRLNKNFLLWTCITIFSFWIVRSILFYLNISGGFLYFILMGLGIFLIGQIIQKMD